jgi:hypothetical protein
LEGASVVLHSMGIFKIIELVLPCTLMCLLCNLISVYWYVSFALQLVRLIACLILSLRIFYGLGRCGAGPSADLISADDAFDGILGFGKSNSSIISQLASSGRVKKMFAHCLDGVNGGGIFAIGNVVQPKVNTTPLVPDQYVVPFPMNFNYFYCLISTYCISLLNIGPVHLSYLWCSETFYYGYLL